MLHTKTYKKRQYHIAIVVRPPSLKSFAKKLVNSQSVHAKKTWEVTCDLPRVFQHDHSMILRIGSEMLHTKLTTNDILPHE